MWEPITPLTDAELALNTQEFESLANTWLDQRARLETDNPADLKEFNERLRRLWSVETGILENLYMIDRGTTQTLVDRGFHQDLIDKASTDTEPATLVAMLKDHLDASDMIQVLVEGERPLTAHVIKQLHQVLTRHQPWVDAVDSLGNSTKVEHLRGDWKKLPNKTELMETGEERYYCPPEQVEGEIQSLLRYLSIHEEQSVNVCLLAAWLHHRFTYIHPFQDANGRVARALVNYLFIKARLFPAVIDREEKFDYRGTLQAGDSGDLEPLVRLLAEKEIIAIKQALSLLGADDGAKQAVLMKDLAKGIVDRHVDRRRKRELDEQARLREVTRVLDGLWQIAKHHLEMQLRDFSDELLAGGLKVSTNLDAGGSNDERGYYWKGQVIDTARGAGQWANFDEETRWIRVRIVGEGVQLRFVLSFHHVGRVLTGVGEVTAFADLKPIVSVDEEPNDAPQPRSVKSMLQPFSLTWSNDPDELAPRFQQWLDECLPIALREWADSI